MKVIVYIEGGGQSKDLKSRCREGFRKLFAQCGFAGHKPKLVACGSREAVFNDFKTATQANSGNDFIAMLVDSEDPVDDTEATWNHLSTRDDWSKPDSTADEQVLFMTTCMETWIVAGRATLREHYGSQLQQNSLPALVGLEAKSRQTIQQALKRATRNCSNNYGKGSRSFEVVAKLSPDTLEQHLPSFERVVRILREKC